MFRIRNFFKAKLWVKITVIGLPLVLIGYSAWIFVITPWIWCGNDVRRIDDQCIGVTDGSTPLSVDLADVLEKIRQENERVGPDNPDAVSVAYLIPVPKPSADGELSAEPRLRHELQGAHIAQLQANQTEERGGKPLIRLLVANYGDNSSQWHEVVPKLLDKVNGPDRLVAVVATGNTVDATLEAITALRSGGLPVVMSRLAGDSSPQQDAEEPPNLRGGLARLAPSGRDQGAAAANYLKPTAKRALIVRDTNPEDPFVRALDEAFRGTFRGDSGDDTHRVLEPPETYDSSIEGVPNAMKGILLSICHQKPEVVYFAGRNSALGSFIQELPQRPCLDLRINVMASGGSTAELAARIERGEWALIRGMEANVSVQYTAQAHPGAWAASPESFHGDSTSHLTTTCEQHCFTTVFRGESLEDGGAIIGYDAILTAVTAIRPNQQGVFNDTPELITQEFRRLHGAAAIPGATGWISLDQFGNPVNKAVVILQVEPNGTLKFIKLSSISGSPCAPYLADRKC
ncbi:MAG: ABC transporter substrate-binding protein [Pseudonocardiales bacterium]